MGRYRVGRCTDVHPRCPTGVSTSVALLQRELRRLGHEAWIVAPAAPGHPREGAGLVPVRSL
ncbi:MAG: glycosyltransferase family 4 protein, partial [Chloroflexota bacterium]|nr:glycosyltransferase family 4 protein [Chloroflexota bacterium]